MAEAGPASIALPTPFGLALKRGFDVVAAAAALVVLAPVLLVVSLLVWRYFGRPLLFRQERPGRHGRPFRLLKFRTMTDERDDGGNLLPDSQRLTGFGRFLRGTSLDELPELINVLRGEMSLVGPRPLLTRYYPYFREEERVRFTMRPGVTGLAQVRGRNDMRWDDRIKADVEYVRNWSFWLDLRILFATVLRVTSRKGLRVDPGSTMLDFDEERRRAMGEVA